MYVFLSSLSLWKISKLFFGFLFRPQRKSKREREGTRNTFVSIATRISIASDRTAWIFFFCVVPFYVVVVEIRSFSFFILVPWKMLVRPLCRENSSLSGGFLRNTTHLIINTQTMTRFICFPSKLFLFSHPFLVAGNELTMKRRLRSFFCYSQDKNWSDRRLDGSWEFFLSFSNNVFVTVSSLWGKSLSRDDGKVFFDVFRWLFHALSFALSSISFIIVGRKKKMNFKKISLEAFFETKKEDLKGDFLFFWWCLHIKYLIGLMWNHWDCGLW